MIFCFWKNTLHILYDTKSDSIEVVSCPSSRSILKRVPLDEFEKIEDKFEFLENILNENKIVYCYQDNERVCEKGNLESVEVSIQMNCNLNCNFCFVKDWSFTEETPKKLPKLHEVQKEVLNSLKNKNLKCIRLTDRGEPLFFIKDTYNYIRSLTLSDTERLDFTTNGTLITPELIEIMENSEIKFSIGVSLNAFSEQTYKKICGSNMFNTVIDNIKLLKKYLSLNKNLSEVRVSFVITDEIFENEKNEDINKVLKELEGTRTVVHFHQQLNKKFENTSMYNFFKSLSQESYKFIPLENKQN